MEDTTTGSRSKLIPMISLSIYNYLAIIRENKVYFSIILQFNSNIEKDEIECGSIKTYIDEGEHKYHTHTMFRVKVQNDDFYTEFIKCPRKIDLASCVLLIVLSSAACLQDSIECLYYSVSFYPNQKDLLFNVWKYADRGSASLIPVTCEHLYLIADNLSQGHRLERWITTQGSERDTYKPWTWFGWDYTKRKKFCTCKSRTKLDEKLIPLLDEILGIKEHPSLVSMLENETFYSRMVYKEP